MKPHPGRSAMRHRHNRLLATTAMLIAVGATITTSPAHAATPQPTPQTGAEYVALGSSFAAGGGLGSPAESDLGQQCGRTLIGYPYAVADALDLQLTNASCGGATTANIANTPQLTQSFDGSTSVVPLQIDSVGVDTDIVTITIGGNDVNYAGNLLAEACLGDLAANPGSEISNAIKPYGLCNPLTDSAVLNRMAGLQDSLIAMVRSVQERAPQARILLVDYLTVLPENGKPCGAVPIPQDRQKFLLDVARQLSLATKHAAQQTGVEFVAASKLSRGHDACATTPWVTGYDFSRGFVIMHPQEEGHAAVAEAVVRQLTSRGGAS